MKRKWGRRIICCSCRPVFPISQQDLLDLSHLNQLLSVKEKETLSFNKHAFNEYQSSLLPFDRPIPDTRFAECRTQTYDISKFPKTSVIICFVNEAWSTLLRSVRCFFLLLFIVLISCFLFLTKFSASRSLVYTFRTPLFHLTNTPHALTHSHTP